MTQGAALERWVELAASLARQPEGCLAVPVVLDLLHETFGSAVEWAGLRVDRELTWFVLHAPPGWPSPEELQRSLVLPTGDPHIRARDVTRDLDQQLVIPVRLSATGDEVFVLCGDAIGDDDLALATQVQPLLMVLRRLADLTAASEVAVRDTFSLTGREAVVVSLLRRGLTQGAIARRLGCSPRTVEKHLERIYRKLGVADRLAAVRRAEACAASGAGPPRDRERPDLMVLHGSV